MLTMHDHIKAYYIFMHAITPAGPGRVKMLEAMNGYWAD